MLILIITMLASTAAADAREDQLALARVCVHEAGFDATEEECAAIHAVLQQTIARGRATSIAGAVRVYSPSVYDRDRRDLRAWVPYLDPRGREPERWPTMVTVHRRGVARVVQHAPWRHYRTRWLALYEAAGRILRGEVSHECETTPDHWGGAMDRDHASANGLVVIDCGETLNMFYMIPQP